MTLNIKPIFTINDFPPEIIRLFAPDLRPKTISTLRLVSPRFCEVFRADCYYQCYLCYPDKPELYEDDHEAGDQKDRWKRCLEAEKRRISVNWRSGRPTRFDTVVFPNCRVQSLKGLTDKHGEYWMLCKCVEEKIVLLNITRKPILTVCDLSPYRTRAWSSDWAAEIAPGQVVISGTNASHVFNYKKQGDNLSLEYKFKIEGMETERVIISENSKVARNLLLNYDNSTLIKDGEGLLQVWDITKNKELESIALRDFSSFTQSFKHQSCSIKVFAGKFPNVLVTVSVKNAHSSNSGVAIVNIVTRQITNFFGWIYDLDFDHLLFNDSYAGLVDNYGRSNINTTFTIYALRNTFDGTRQQPVMSLMTDKILRPRLIESTILISYFNFAFNDRTDPDLYTISIDDLDTQRRYHTPDSMKCIGSSVYTIIGPFWIFKSDIFGFSQLLCKTFDEYGNEVIDWSKKLQENRPVRSRREVVMEGGFRWNYCYLHHPNKPNMFLRDIGLLLPPGIEHLQNLFKFTLQTEDGNLVIFTFQ